MHWSVVGLPTIYVGLMRLRERNWTRYDPTLRPLWRNPPRLWLANQYRSRTDRPCPDYLGFGVGVAGKSVAVLGSGDNQVVFALAVMGAK